MIASFEAGSHSHHINCNSRFNCTLTYVAIVIIFICVVICLLSCGTIFETLQGFHHFQIIRIWSECISPSHGGMILIFCCRFLSNRTLTIVIPVIVTISPLASRPLSLLLLHGDSLFYYGI